MAGRSEIALEKKKVRLDNSVEHRSISKAAYLWQRIAHALTATADR